MNTQIRRLGTAMIVMFVVLFAAVNRIQVFAEHEISTNPANARLIVQSFKVDRGDILAADGRTVLAKSVRPGERSSSCGGTRRARCTGTSRGTSR